MNSPPLSESMPSNGKGRQRRTSSSASKVQRRARLRTMRTSVQPLATSVTHSE